MIVLSGADLVLPDRVLPAATLVIENGAIAAIHADSRGAASSSHFGLHGHTVVPGFVDVHVHGVSGVDTLDDGDAIASLAAALPRFGVTALCPTTVACAPSELERVLMQVHACRRTPPPNAARVLPAHLESNFINPSFRGAQPGECLRTYIASPLEAGLGEGATCNGFSAADIVQVLERYAGEIGIVTLAPEIEGGLDLVARLGRLGIRAAIGHSGASYETACAAIDAGVRHATHLFNAMPPLHHRTPGLVGAVLERDEVTAELICDAVHVHPAMVRLAVGMKGTSRVMAISDGTAASALTVGSTVRLGNTPITADRGCARLADGTMAGSTLTMDAAFRLLTRDMGFSPVDAAHLCATTPARHLGLSDQGTVEEGAAADLVVLHADGSVVQTYVGGRLVYNRGTD